MTSRSMKSSLWIAVVGWWFLSWSTLYNSTKVQRTNPFLLGVTLDAAKHEFSVDWIRSFMSNIHKMGFNALHLTLPSDHRFARNASGFETSELKALATHARSLDNLTIIPEISVTDATTWPIPPLPCPVYICSEERRITMSRMNLPLDIRHPEIRSVVTKVLQNLVEGLQNPTLLHLGELGSYDHAQHVCWKEVLAASNGRNKPYYNKFGSTLQKILMDDLGYQPRVLLSRQAQEMVKSSKTPLWEFQNYKSTTTTTTQQQASYLLQPKPLDLSTSLLKDHSTGYAVYQETMKFLQDYEGDYYNGLLEGIVVSTEGLPSQWFEDRNILGRLLAISMAVQDFTKQHPKEQESQSLVKLDQATFETIYRVKCDKLFDQGNICNRLGGLSTGDQQQDKTNERRYKKRYAKLWKDQAVGICHNLTETREHLKLRKPTGMKLIRARNFDAHFGSVGETFDFGTQIAIEAKETLHHPLFHEVFGQSKIPLRGFIVDLVDEPGLDIRELMEEIMVPLGLNTLQVSLRNHLEPLLRNEILEECDHVLPKHSLTDKRLSHDILRQIADEGDRLGIEVIPEISITTQAADWYPAGYLRDCPNAMCSVNGGDLAAATHDVNHGSVLPMVLAVIERIRRIFSSGSFLHLGSDERSLSEACWKESGETPRYDTFERLLSSLLEREKWYNASNILRWENAEGIVYPKRTGRITQYRYKNGSLPSMDDNHHVFGSIFITPEKDPWAVYQETREWVHISGGMPPRGLLARIHVDRKKSNNHQYMASILAFAVGLSTEDPMLKDSSSLELYLSDVLCAADNQKSRLCPSPSMDGKVAQIQPSFAASREQMMCNAMTHVISGPIMRSQTSAKPIDLRDNESSKRAAADGQKDLSTL